MQIKTISRPELFKRISKKIVPVNYDGDWILSVANSFKIALVIKPDLLLF